MLVLPPLSLYIHIPWCVKKCPYCDFNSHVHSQRELPEQAYLEQLKKDLAADLCFVQGRSLQSIFIGGGTPSLMSPNFYKALLAYIEQKIPFTKAIEITLEANPGTTEATRFDGYREAGINRLSLGVQSFNDTHLSRLGRIHSSQDACIAIEQAKAAGFENFNIDLMHGLPDQTKEQAMADIDQAISLEPTHLSWYQLTIEQNTEFFSRPPILPEDETLWAIQEQGVKRLADEGYHQYEVSAYAKNGHRAAHNLNYWTFGDYIGIGAGAHSKVSIRDSKRILRYRKSRAPKDYLKPSPLFRVAEEQIEKADLPFEFMMNVLRLNEGVDERTFEERTACSLAAIQPVIDELREQELLEKEQLAVTEKGHLFLNSLLERFI